MSEHEQEIIRQFFSPKGQSKFISELKKRNAIIEKVVEPKVLVMRKALGADLALLQSYQNDLFYYGVDNLYGKVLGIFYGQLGDVKNPQERYDKLYRVVGDLSKGIGTPLLITFKPQYAYFPLEISRLNKGHSYVEVYVIGNKPVKDRSGVLQVDRSKRITRSLRSKLVKHFPIGGLEYVTRLFYKGDSSGFTADAYF